MACRCTICCPRGVIGRQYFIFGITDETYSLLSASGKVKDSETALWVVLLNQSYWVLGTLIGIVLARGLPPGLQGLDFALTALFTVLAVEQIRAKKDWGAVTLGGVAAVVAGIWVSDYFLLAASIMLVLVLLAWPERNNKGKAAHV
ncbi:AzlC family ABC transporter permease [Oceanimonas baumannii]|uniref:AzlC family ABC transporter permease n=1 Tax=Oceanimonas baumannii TaxID=129578 RepID=UPI002B1CCF41|nr:AzlC family ABC transporter permease [Oceanimonas baumannii]